MNKELILTRDSSPEDMNFIYSTWLRGLYFGNDWFREIDQDTYFKAYQLVVEQVLTRSKVQVICLRDDHDTILSYCVSEGTKLHYIFTKPVWRKFGLAKQLIPKDIDTVTHLTNVGRSIKPKGWKFNPFL